HPFCQLGDLVLVGGEGEVGLIAPVFGKAAALDDLQVYSTVKHTGHVNGGIGYLAYGGRQLGIIQQVVGAFMIPVKNNVHGIIEQGNVQADVGGDIGFPAAFGVADPGLVDPFKSGGAGAIYGVSGKGGAGGIEVILVVEVYALVAHFTPAAADLQLVEPGNVLQEIFLADAPAAGNSGKSIIAVGNTEVGGAIPPEHNAEEVPVLQGIIHLPENGEDIIARAAVAGHGTAG